MVLSQSIALTGPLPRRSLSNIAHIEPAALAAWLIADGAGFDLNYGAAAAPSFDRQAAKVWCNIDQATNSHLATYRLLLHDRCRRLKWHSHEPHLILRDGTPVLIRRLVAEDAAFIPIF